MTAALAYNPAAARAAPAASVDGMARSYSKMVLLAETCPAFYKMDVGVARRYAAAFEEIATKAGGAAALGPEVRRRRHEVEVTGRAQWCQVTRDALLQLGAKDIFP